jgi:hypothetical protein
MVPTMEGQTVRQWALTLSIPRNGRYIHIVYKPPLD